MRMSDLLIVSMRNLWRRKLRTLLTILGVIIGTTSIVLMMSLGVALNKSFQEQIDQMGGMNTIEVYATGNYSSSSSSSDNDALVLDDAMIDRFSEIEGVEVASPIIELSLKMKSGKYVGWLNVQGIDPKVLEAQDVTLESGQLVEDGQRLSFVFGSEVASNFYNPNSRDSWNYSDEPLVDVMNDKIKVSYDMNYGEADAEKSDVRPYNITVVGLLSEGQSDHDYYAYTTIEQAKEIEKDQEEYEEKQAQASGETSSSSSSNRASNKEETYNQAIVQVADMDDVSEVQEEIQAMGFQAYSNMQYLSQIQEQSNVMQLVLGGIGAVSLLVAAIGITNTMIMSIYERTKEIGVMKVVGARIKDIKRMFLVEASLIGFFGGGLGLGVSYIGSKILNYVGQNVNFMMTSGGSDISIIPAWLALMALAFTTLIGLVSGYLPAVRAMKLSVLNALRTN